MTLRLQGTGQPIEIDPGGPAWIIGERINPSGKPALRKALVEGEWSYVAGEAQRQVDAGANLIDVNVGSRGTDEPAILPKVVRAVASTVRVPLCIDTRNPAALESALLVCPGRPLVNSISAEPRALEKLLPIVADWKLPVIALCMGQTGVPTSVDGRLACAHQVLEAAVQAGIREQDVVFDPLVMSVGADDQAAHVTLETVRRLREVFPTNNITGGASNVSYGLPGRPRLNAGFVAVAVYLGMNLPIMDPLEVDLRFSLLSSVILLGRDERLRRYVRHHRSLRSNEQGKGD